MKYKKATFIVWTETPGWFVDEAFKKSLMITIFGLEYKCNVIVYGLDKYVDDFIKYIEEQDFDISIEKIQEIDLE